VLSRHRGNDSRSLGNFQSREWSAAFGLAAHVGERVGERTDQKAERNGGFGNLSRERPWGSAVCEFRGVVFQGELKARSLRDGDNPFQYSPAARRGGKDVGEVSQCQVSSLHDLPITPPVPILLPRPIER
jgi:hypothetical protein